jgi:hypothetical protein
VLLVGAPAPTVSFRDHEVVVAAAIEGRERFRREIVWGHGHVEETHGPGIRDVEHRHGRLSRALEPDERVGLPAELEQRDAFRLDTVVPAPAVVIDPACIRLAAEDAAAVVDERAVRPADRERARAGGIEVPAEESGLDTRSRSSGATAPRVLAATRSTLSSR